ncbi:MAG: DEAD/DEAH box helicase [Candidatus Caldarchaeum sp.]
MIDTSDLLQRLGYDYHVFVEKAVTPPTVDEKFGDILLALKLSTRARCLELAGKKLYVHQKKALESLSEGCNLILKAGSGSGKTEAWFLYSAKCKVKTLAVYPTLALSNDQQERLHDYCSALGMNAVPIDAVRKDEYVRQMEAKGLRNLLANADIVVTNPAYLLNELKRIGSNKSSYLKTFLTACGLIVLDEFDFYGPRSISMLLTMMQLVAEMLNPKIQVTVMTATLQDPYAVAEILTSINGRPSRIVDGEPFHPENRTYLVLGKSLVKLWRMIRSQTQKLRETGVGDDVIQCLKDFNSFRMNFFKVIEASSAAGLDIPEYFEDPSEILKHYASDESLTIVFTNSISSAEEMCRRILSRLDSSRTVATHHHLLLKSQRREIEEAARTGTVKMIFTPRTLSQGIDIGTVRRVVHLGLPKNIREFRQREGRKGRRPDIEWTETIVIPYSQWDRDLLSRGVEVFRKWSGLPLERAVVNADNLYSRLFKSLFAFQSPLLRKKMDKDDMLFLRSLGLESDGLLTKTGKMTWLKMNFYEFAPPYGIKRWRVAEDGTLRNLEDISHVDLVEKFQPGSIEPSSDGVVFEVRVGGSKGRVVTAVVVDDLNPSKLRRHDALAPVLEEYERVKLRWGESPSLRRDFYTGRISSEVHLVVHAPSNGFGLYTKFPNRVEWRIASGRKQLINVGEKTYVSRLVKSIEVPTPTYGMYSDYTYGLSVEASPVDDPMLLKLGACLLLIVLRRLHNISLDLLKYGVLVLGERKVIVLHETESACLLPKIDWKTFYDEVSAYTPDELDEVFLQQIDELAYATFISLKLDWQTVKTYALKIIEYFLLRERLRLQVGTRVLEVAKPSKALKAVSLSAIPVILREDLGAGLYSVALFDGEVTHTATGVLEFKQPADDAAALFTALTQLINHGFRLLVYDKESTARNLENCGLESLKAFVYGLEKAGKLVDVKHELANKLEKEIPLEVLETSLGLRREVDVAGLVVRAEMERRRRPSMRFIRSKPESLAQLVEAFLKDEVRNIFIAWLVSKAV